MFRTTGNCFITSLHFQNSLYKRGIYLYLTEKNIFQTESHYNETQEFNKIFNPIKPIIKRK